MLLAAAAIVRVVPEVMDVTSTAATISLPTVASAPRSAPASEFPDVVVAVAVLVKVAVAPMAALVPAAITPRPSPRALAVTWLIAAWASAPTDVADAVLVPSELAVMPTEVPVVRFSAAPVPRSIPVESVTVTVADASAVVPVAVALFVPATLPLIVPAVPIIVSLVSRSRP